MSEANYLLVYKWGFKILGPMTDSSLNDARKLFYSKGYKTYIVGKPPAARTLRRWKQQGEGRATDGCTVKGLCSCQHGCRSWLAVFAEKMRYVSK